MLAWSSVSKCNGHHGAVTASLSSGLLSLMADSQRLRATRWQPDRPRFFLSPASIPHCPSVLLTEWTIIPGRVGRMLVCVRSGSQRHSTTPVSTITEFAGDPFIDLSGSGSYLVIVDIVEGMHPGAEQGYAAVILFQGKALVAPTIPRSADDIRATPR